MSNVFGMPAQRGADPGCANGLPLSPQGENRHATARAVVRSARRARVVLLLACVAGSAATLAVGAPVCKPALAVKEAKLSDMLPPTYERKWTAVVSVDASRCATTAGYFEVGLAQIKENAVDSEFHEEFIWSAPSVLIGVDLWADEAVQAYWVHRVQACPCAR